MVTVLEVIQRGTDFLARKEVDSPRLQVELLLAHVLRVPRMRLYLDFARELSVEEVARARELVSRRATREPLQQIIGSTSFCGYEIEVNREVLVPRPETELLAEKAWEFLNATTATSSRAPKVLDFGTGSGCIAVAVAHKCPAARVTAMDASPAALEVARRNAARHQLEGRIEFVHGAALGALPVESQYDLVVSNPPYIPTADLRGLQPEVRNYEPRTALDGGVDGLDFYRLLAAGAAAYLAEEGRLMVEFGDGQEGSLEGLFVAQNWIVEAINRDYTGRPRILAARLNPASRS